MKTMPTSLSELPPDVVAFDIGPQVVKATASLTGVAALMVATRFGVRWRASSGLTVGIDDWLIFLALSLLCAFTATAWLGVYKGGVGRHLVVNMLKDPELLQNALMYLYISEFIYFTLLLSMKASIFIMYIRIFPTRFMRTGVYILGTIAGVRWLVTILVTLFQCSPIEKAYMPYLVGGSCLDKSKFFLGSSVPNIVEDIVILLLPTPQIWKLKVPKAQKVAICAVFLLGFLMIIVACVRLESLIELVGNQDDITKAIAPGWILTAAEPAVGIVTASLPTMRPLLRFIFGRAFASKQTHNGDEEEARRETMTIGGSFRKSRGYASRLERLVGSHASSHSSNSVKSGDDDKDGRPDTPAPWPSAAGYAFGNRVTIYGKPVPSSADIPLVSITVRRDFRWTTETVHPRDKVASEQSETDAEVRDYACGP